MMAFQPDCVEFNGRTGNFSLINGTNKLENIVTLPEEYSSLQFSLLLSDMIKINWRSPNDDRQKNEITEYFVPLTVTFAVDETIGGVYSEQAQTLIADYLTKFKKYNEEILGICPEDVEDSVRGKWNISFDLIKDKSPAVAYLLTVCAFLASEDISLDLISKGITNRSETEETISIDNISLEAAKQSLSHYSLIR
jgi:hypothetical protein